MFASRECILDPDQSSPGAGEDREGFLALAFSLTRYSKSSGRSLVQNWATGAGAGICRFRCLSAHSSCIVSSLSD